jgi:hypothetical protein
MYTMYHYHHQPINVPTAGAQAFLMVPTRRTGQKPPRRPSADFWMLMTAVINGLACLPKHRGVRDHQFLVTHPMNDQRCLGDRTPSALTTIRH